MLKKLKPGESFNLSEFPGLDDYWYDNVDISLGLNAAFDPAKTHRTFTRRGQEVTNVPPAQNLQNKIYSLLFEEHSNIGNYDLVWQPGVDKDDPLSSRAASLLDVPPRRVGQGVLLSADEASAASAYIGAMKLDELVKQSIQRKRFVLPQQTRNVDAGFCNEAVYGRLNLLSVTGVVRLDSSIDASSVRPSRRPSTHGPPRML